MSARHFLTFLSAGLFAIGTVCARPSPDLRQVLDPAEPARGDSLIWTALPAKSWQDLGRAVGVPDIDLRLPDGRTPNPIGKALHGTAAQLDNALPPSTKIWAGAITPAFVARINQELEVLFPGRLQRITVPDQVRPGSCLAVSALNHRLTFAQPFYQAKGRTMRFRTSSGKVVPVHFFGTQGAANTGFPVNSVQVHAYRSPSDFILQISTKSREESLWIVRSPGAPSIQSHMETVKPSATANADAQPPETAGLTDLDVVQIPYVNFTNITEHTRALAGSFEVPDNPLHKITGCHQWIQFELTEGGAVIRAKLDLMSQPFGSPPPPPKKPQPRQFICDGPFSLLLWRQGAALPYAAFHLDGGKWQKL